MACLAEWLNSEVTGGTFREPLRLTDRRARVADRQETRPTFTGWSGYPTHLVVCDRDGMTVRAADHRVNTSVRFGGLTLLPSALAGLAVCDAVILYVVHRMRKMSSPKTPRQAGQHGG